MSTGFDSTSKYYTRGAPPENDITGIYTAYSLTRRATDVLGVKMGWTFDDLTEDLNYHKPRNRVFSQSVPAVKLCNLPKF